MAEYTIHLAQEENIVLSAATVRRLIAAGSGDAALLYLALLENRGAMAPEKLLTALRWDARRLSRAEAELMNQGLLGSHQPALTQEPGDERPDYTREDVARQLERDEKFRLLTRNVENALGKKLSTPDLNILLGLYDYLGLPCEVIFLLVNHCAERVAARYGPGRRPTLRQIEKEGYAWARRGLMDLESANTYLMKYAQSRTLVGQYMAVLGLGDRPPAPTEERYLTAWAEMGFPAECVELAYDKTMLKCRELRWSYLNRILASWHEKGLHTLKEVEEGDRRPVRQQRAPERPAPGSNVERMKKYLENSRK